MEMHPMVSVQFLKSKILNIPDYPKKGVGFKDITPLLEDARAFQETVNGFVAALKYTGINKVVGIDARGFLLAAPVAYALSVGLVIVRKRGKLPRETVSAAYDLEYGSNVLEMHRGAIAPGERVVIVDDVLATGGTLKATARLIEELGGKVSAISVLMELEFLKGRENLPYPIYPLVTYAE